MDQSNYVFRSCKVVLAERGQYPRIDVMAPIQCSKALLLVGCYGPSDAMMRCDVFFLCIIRVGAAGKAELFDGMGYQPSSSRTTLGEMRLKRTSGKSR
jgi:hypothetical protein